MRTLKYSLQCQSFSRGFTLIEVLLAITISAVVLTVAYASFFQIVKSKDMTEESLETYHEARVILSRITQDISKAFIPGGIYPQGKDYATPLFIGERTDGGSALRFATFSSRPVMDSGWSDEVEVFYYLVQNPEGEEYSLMRRENPAIGIEDSGIEYPLSGKVVYFQLSYISESRDTGEIESLEEWNSSLTGTLPMAVEVRFALRKPDGEVAEFSTLIPIPTAN